MSAQSKSAAALKNPHRRLQTPLSVDTTAQKGSKDIVKRHAKGTKAQMTPDELNHDKKMRSTMRTRQQERERATYFPQLPSVTIPVCVTSVADVAETFAASSEGYF
jgi:hypothetical protein